MLAHPDIPLLVTEAGIPECLWKPGDEMDSCMGHVRQQLTLIENLLAESVSISSRGTRVPHDMICVSIKMPRYYTRYNRIE